MWDPPSRFAMTWHPGSDPARATNVEVRFTVEGESTRVDLVHSGWEKAGDGAASRREGYSPGWDFVLAGF